MTSSCSCLVNSQSCSLTGSEAVLIVTLRFVSSFCTMYQIVFIRMKFDVGVLRRG